MAGLVPAIHVFAAWKAKRGSPDQDAMTTTRSVVVIFADPRSAAPPT
jgi:hypothetical protein